jgi:predicted nucleic acid-binding protein
VIVVDTNVLIHLGLQTPDSQAAHALVEKDANWYAPYLWRSEFRNTLVQYVRHQRLTLDEARNANRLAEELMYGHELFVDPNVVLELAFASTCTAYDCEFVALATELRIPLITTDKQILHDFPRIARPLADYR